MNYIDDIKKEFKFIVNLKEDNVIHIRTKK